MAILALAALSPSVAFAHAPINSPALKLSVAKLASAAVIGSSGVSSVITMMPALRAFSTVGTIADGVAGHEQNALGAGGHQRLDGGDLAVVVAVGLAGVGLQGDAEFLGFRLSAFLHLDEEGIGVGLGDQADDGLGGERRRAHHTRSTEPRSPRSTRIANFLDMVSSRNNCTGDGVCASRMTGTKRRNRLWPSRVRAVAPL